MMNSPISWVGGKRLLRKEIVKRIPEHICYVEVFCGAAWVLFGKERSHVEVINDLNGELANLWRCLRERPLELVEKLEWMLSSQEDFLRERDCDPSNKSETDRAARFYWLLKSAFGCRMIGASFGYSVKQRTRFNVESLKAELEPIRQRLLRVLIFNEDFGQVIKRFDRPITFFYLDPPYFHAPGCYAHEFSGEDHQRLCDTLRNIKGKFLLSYGDCREVRELYSWASIEEVTTNYSIRKDRSGRKPDQELLISNYEQPK